MAWSGFALAFAVFFLSHSVPVRSPVKPWLVSKIGATGFTLAYSAMSLAVLAWLIMEAGRAPFVPLWHQAAWQLYVPLIVMLPVCLIIALSVGRPNPFSFGGANNDAFDPQSAGVVRITRHPLLLALALWAVAHIVPNGDVAHVILFGTFAAFAVLGRTLIDARKKREMGYDWDTTIAAVAQTPVLASVKSALIARRLIAGVAIYITLIAAHPILLGISPFP